MIKLVIPKELKSATMVTAGETQVIPILKDSKELIGKAHIKRDEQSKDYYAELLITKDAQKEYSIEESETPFTVGAEIIDAKQENEKTTIETYRIKFLNV